MAKTPIEDLRLKGTRFYENLATGNTPVDLYTGRDMSGRLIKCGELVLNPNQTVKSDTRLGIPIKNKRGKKGASLSTTYLIKGTLVEHSPTAGPHIVVHNNLTDFTPLTLKMQIPKPVAVDTLILVTFEFDRHHVNDKPGSPHFQYKNEILFNGYSAGKAKISGEFSSMYDFPIILEAGATELVFYASLKEPIDAIIMAHDAKRPLGAFEVEYFDTSIIYYDHTKKQHVSEVVPAQTDFFIEKKEVSNIITIAGPSSANGALLKKFDDNAEFFAQYILNSGGWKPKDPKNPIPNATRYYPCTEESSSMYDMLSRAYKSELRLTAKKGIAQSKVIFNVSVATKIKVNGIQYLIQPSPGTNWQGPTVNNALNDGDIVCTFEDARLVIGFRIFNNASPDSFIGGFPDLTLFPNLNTIMLRKASFQGPFPKNTWTNKIVEIDKPTRHGGGIAWMREFGEDWDMSGATNPALKEIKLDQIHCSTMTFPPQIESLEIYGLNIGPGAVPKEQTWEFILKGLSKLKHFNTWDARGLIGHMPTTDDCPLLESFSMGYSNGGVLNPTSVFGLPGFDKNPKLKSIRVAWCPNNIGAHKKWWAKNKPGKPFPEPFGSELPLFKNNPDLEDVNLAFFANPYRDPITKEYQYIPDWSKAPIKKLVLSYPAQCEGKLIPAHFPTTLESFSTDESVANGVAYHAPLGIWSDAMMKRLVNLKKLSLRDSPSIIVDISVFNGYKMTHIDLDGWGRGTNQRIGTMCDFTTTPNLFQFKLIGCKGVTGTFKKPLPALKEISLAGIRPHALDRTAELALDGGFPNLASNSLNILYVGQSTIGHEGGTKSALPVLTGSKASLKEYGLYDLPNIAGAIPDIHLFPNILLFEIGNMPKITGKIPTIGVLLLSGPHQHLQNVGHSVRIYGNKNITDYAGTATARDGNINTIDANYRDNNLTALAVESILIAFSKGDSIGRTSLYLDNPVYEASKAAHAIDPKKPIQAWRNKAPDLNKPAVKKAIADLKTKTVKVFLPI